MTDDYDDHDETDSPPAKCKSCGVPLVEHLGLYGTCARLQEARLALRVIRTWATFKHGKEMQAKNVAWLCDKVLKGTK